MPHGGFRNEIHEYIANGGGGDIEGMVSNPWAQQPSNKAEQCVFDEEGDVALSTEYIEKGAENSILAKIDVLSPLKNKFKGISTIRKRVNGSHFC